MQPTPILMNGIQGVLTDTLLWTLVLVTPFVVFALLIHWIERFVFVRLAERFGWKVVLWTGWLGTPIHELSHALACYFFQHKIDEMALFEPDMKTGRLGFVRHSYRRGNWYQELGNFFIGVAPLVGGSLALGLLLWLFYPDAAVTTVKESLEQELNPFESALAILKSMVSGTNLLTLRFWTFLYLVLCVGGHMAPSRSDYEGASRSVWMVLSLIVVGSLILALAQLDIAAGIARFSRILTPLFALFLLTLVLCGLAAVVVYLLTSFFPRRFRVGLD